MLGMHMVLRWKMIATYHGSENFEFVKQEKFDML